MGRYLRHIVQPWTQLALGSKNSLTATAVTTQFIRESNKIQTLVSKTVWRSPQFSYSNIKPDEPKNMTSVNAQISSVILALFGIQTNLGSSCNHNLLADKTYNLYKWHKMFPWKKLSKDLYALSRVTLMLRCFSWASSNSLWSTKYTNDNNSKNN